MKFKPLIIVTVFVLTSGCIGQLDSVDLKITEVVLSKVHIEDNQTTEVFVTVKSYENNPVNVSVRLLPIRESDSPYLIFEPAVYDYGLVKKGEEIRKSFTLQGFVAAGEEVVYKFKIELFDDNTTFDSEEAEIAVSR